MRLFGIETEYGLAIEGRSASDQIDDAADFVQSVSMPAFIGWDYSQESPRNDLRGFKVDSLAVDPIDAQFDSDAGRTFDRSTHVDRVLTNGARIYNDHGHPEYATPECARIMDLIAQDAAGEQILLATAKNYFERTGRIAKLYKNNTDFHGASYGTHENFLVSRSVSHSDLLNALIPLLIARPILCGAGKVGSEVGRPCKFQLSQRADFFHEIANIETLYRRPLFNTRDEPHADPKSHYRLHIIAGDANRMQWATAMKVLVVSIALDLIEIGCAPNWKVCNPVQAAQSISKDESLQWRIELEGGSWTNGIEILDAYLSAAARHIKGASAEIDWALGEWRIALIDAASNPKRLADRVDWAAKREMLNEFAESEGEWPLETMQALDLEYHNIDPEESLFSAWKEMGRAQNLVSKERVLDAMRHPPLDTRAFLRGWLVENKSNEIESLGWRRAKLKDGSKFELPVEINNWAEPGLAEQFFSNRNV